MSNKKIPTLTEEEVKQLGVKLANQYETESRERVKNKKYPENRYTFTQKHFRPIKGWDTEWYDVMYEWVTVLKSKGWQERWADKDLGEMCIGNFQYLYDADPATLGVPPVDMTIEGMMKRVNLNKLDPQYCSQVALED